MFGRSGQMFPRRAYHDAIYEEEYGSETEEECCRGRGLSAILCWFLSVIILVGLAASVVLTVFFILRSRSFLSKNNAEDVNVVFDHGNGFKIVPTIPTDDNFDFTSSSSKTPFGHDDSGGVTTSIESTAARTTTFTTTATTTKLPTTSRMTTRKYYSDTTGQSHENFDKERTTPLPPVTTSDSMFKFLFDTIKTFQKDGSGESMEKTGIEDEIISNESSDRGYNVPSPTTPTRKSSVQTTTTRTSNTPILFTLPPSTSTLSHSKKNSGSTRNPERTSFSTSEEVTSTPYQQYDHGKHYIPPPSRSSSEETGRVTASDTMDTDVPTTTTERTPTTIDEPTDDGIKYQAEESKKLTNMLVGQIPPHQNEKIEKDPYSKLTTTTLPPPTTVITEDLLAKIIKNLQPKWNKSKIESTPNTKFDHSATSTRIRNRYVEKDRKDNSKENIKEEMNVKIVKRIKYRGPSTTIAPQASTIIFITPENSGTTELPSTTIFTSLTSSRQPPGTSSIFTKPTRKLVNYNSGQPIEIVKGPDFSNGRKSNQQQLKDHSEYFDVLVGSEDQKTLVTKETDAGIITSAILPPWFDTSGNSTDTLEMSNQTMRFTKNQQSDDDETNDHSKPKSDIDILLNLFSNSPLPKSKVNRTGHMSKSEKGGFNPHQQGNHHHHEMTVEESKKSLHLKNLEEQLKPFFSSPSEPLSKASDLNTPEHVQPANNAFHFGSSDGTTNIYGYYPEDDLEEGESVDQVDIDVGRYPPHQKNVSDNKGGKKKAGHEDESEDHLNHSQSHVIDIAYDPKTRPEIVIEPNVNESDDAGEEDGGDEEDEEYSEHDNSNDRRSSYAELTDPIALASETQNHQVFVPPPANMMSTPPTVDVITRRVSINAVSGSGIRRPMSSSEERDDQSMAGSESHPQVVDWSLKSGNDEDEDTTKSHGDDPNQPNEQLINQNEHEHEFSSVSEEEEPHGTEKLVETSNVENQIVERKPIIELDESLYPSKEEQDLGVKDVTTKKPKVYQVYSEPYHPPHASSAEIDTTTTKTPVVLVNSGEVQTQNGTTSNGFIPPEPMNFHDNTYTFNSETNTGYVSKDGWRPVLHNDHPANERHQLRDGNQGKNPHPMNNLLNGDRPNNYYLSTSVQPPPFSSPGISHGTTTSGISSTSSTPLNLHNEMDNASGHSDYEEEEEEDEENNPLSNNWYSTSSTQQQQQHQKPMGQHNNNIKDNQVKEKLKIKPSMPLPASFTHNNNMMPPPSRVKFPDEGQRQQQNQINPFQQQHHHHTQQQLQQSVQNSIIDRTKYMHRPAPPRIVMRRTPQFNFPFNPNRKRNTKTNTGPPPPPPSSPHRNFPRIGTQPQQQSSSYPSSVSAPSGPFSSPQTPTQSEVHPSSLLQNNKIMRLRHERFKNQSQASQQQQQMQSQASAPGAVHWPAEDNFGRRNVHQVNRRPTSG